MRPPNVVIEKAAFIGGPEWLRIDGEAVNCAERANWSIRLRYFPDLSNAS